VNTPVQHALADFLQGHPEFHQRLPAFYQQKRDLFCHLLADSRFRLRPARSTFFQIVDYGEISDELDVALARRWTEEIGVASIPLSVFCEQPFTGTRLRFCFAKDDQTLEAASQKLSSL
jgi:methionine aminotransferase